MANLTWIKSRLFIDTSYTGISLIQQYHEWDLDESKRTGKIQFKRVHLNRQIIDKLFENPDEVVYDLDDLG